MSSYLNIYIPLQENQNNKEEKEEKHIYILQVSRNNDIYTAFNDNINCPFGIENALELTKEKLNTIYEDLTFDLNKNNEKLTQFKLYNKGDYETINEMISLQDFVDDIKKVIDYINFLTEIVDNVTDSGYKVMFYID